MAATHVPSRQKGGPVETSHPLPRHWREALMPLSRWTDDRLDDLARQVQTNTEAIRDYTKIREELIELRGRLESIGEDSRDCLVDLKTLKADLTRRDEEQHRERKSDRRWMLGTALTTAGLIIAALAVFLG